MRLCGLEGVDRRRVVHTTVRDRDAAPAPDLVERHFAASGPDRLWVADITYVPTWSGFLYVAVIVDAWSRMIVGWSMAGHLRTELILDALDMPSAAASRPAGSSTTVTRAPSTRASPSVGARELLDRSSFRTRADAKLAVFDYIEAFYNRHRRHSALGYLSPLAFERRYRSETIAA